MSGSERRKVTEGTGWKVSGKAAGSVREVDESSKIELGKVWENNDREYCQGCRSRVNTGQMGLECGGCRRWFHAKCEKLSKKEYEKICEIDEKVIWHCGECGEILPMILKENRRLEKELMIVKNEMSEIKEMIVALKGSDTSESCDKEKISEIEERIRTEVEKCMDEIKGTRNEQERLKKEKEDLEKEVSQNLGKLGIKIEESSKQTKREIDGKLEIKVRELRQEKSGNENSEKCIASLRKELEVIKEGYNRGSIEDGGSR